MQIESGDPVDLELDTRELEKLQLELEQAMAEHEIKKSQKAKLLKYYGALNRKLLPERFGLPLD
jgi:hypothetical protein